MSQVFLLGPFALQLNIVVLALSYFLAIGLFRLKANNENTQIVKKIAEQGFWLGIVSARLSFVVWHFSSYQDHLLSMIYFWQPGYIWWFGVLAASIYWLVMWFLLKPKAQSAFLVSVLPVLMFYSAAMIGLILLPKPAWQSEPVPVVELVDTNHQWVSLAQFKGRPVVVNFWATWCGPCKREMPLLDRYAKKYQINDDGPVIIAVNIGESLAVVNEYLTTKNFTMPVWLDQQQKLFSQVNGQVTPTTLFINKNGLVEKVKIGELSAATLDQYIDQIQ